MWSIYHSFPFWFVHFVLFMKSYFTLSPSHQKILLVSPSSLHFLLSTIQNFTPGIYFCVSCGIVMLILFLTHNATSVIEQIFTNVHLDLFLGFPFCPGICRSCGRIFPDRPSAMPPKEALCLQGKETPLSSNTPLAPGGTCINMTPKQP